MNPLMKARVLVLLFWVLGMPLLVLSFVAVPNAFSPGPLLARVSWSFVPVLGLIVAGTCILTLLRLDARSGGARFDRQWLGRYYVEALVGFIVYLALFTVGVTVAPTVQDPTLRVLIALAPAAGIALIIVAVVRLVRRADEYHRARMLQSSAVAAAFTVLWTSCYSFLEIIGFPKLHMAWIPNSLMAVWLGWGAGRALLGR
ncbi:MAG TPA: hypothetical protein VLW26_04440 [Steroidobacteraceae bacterium]|nr:hypothetical protein [Steroidobacteraceae bacterium]